jgi:hypothetical protein
MLLIRERRGAMIALGTHGRSLALTQVDPTLAGTVSVRAVSADGTQGATAKVSYRMLHKATSRFEPFSELKAKNKASKKPKKTKKK